MAFDKINYLGENHFKVLNLILKRDFYLRELAEELKLAPSTTHKVINSLKENNILFENKKKNRTYFRVNYSSVLAREMIKTLFVNKILSSKSFKKLLKLKPKKVYLFGSAANGTLKQTSDIDMAAFFKKEPKSKIFSEIRMSFAAEFIRETDLFALEENHSTIPEKSESIKNVEKGILLYAK